MSAILKPNSCANRALGVTDGLNQILTDTAPLLKIAPIVDVSIL